MTGFDDMKQGSRDNSGVIEISSGSPTLDDEVVRPGRLIHVEFRLWDEQGLNVQTDQHSFEAIMGLGLLLPKIESTLIGLHPGDRLCIRLGPKEAFGEWNAEKIIEFDRAEFPPDVAAGDHFEAEQDEASVLVLRIVEVNDDYVKVDLNHPLAGQYVKLELLIVSVRPASKLELDAAKAGQQSQNFGQAGGLMPAGRLLRGRPGR